MSKSSVFSVGLEASGLAAGPSGRKLFEGVNLKLLAGQAVRVVGPNGSGKTTLLRTLCGLALPLAGAVRRHAPLVYIGHSPAIKDELSALENLRTALAVAGVHRTEHEALQALHRLGMADRAHVLGRSLSQGQRRRVSLARLAANTSPEVLVLDEPFTALDANAMATLSQLLQARLIKGSALVYTTHQVHPLTGVQEQVLTLGSHGAPQATPLEVA